MTRPLLLAKFLQDSGLGMFDYICGELYEGDDQGFQSHAWLQRGDLIVDITADQFGEIQRPVLVTRSHEWHNRFNGKVKHVADYELYDERTRNILSAAYENVVSRMQGLLRWQKSSEEAINQYTVKIDATLLTG